MSALSESKEGDIELVPILIVLENPVYPGRISREVSGIFELIDFIENLLRVVDTDRLTDIHECITLVFSELEKVENPLLL